MAKANPGKLSYASAGAGTPPHLAAELFKQQAGIFATHIPYRGAAPALQDVMASQADYVFDPGIAFPHIRSGKVKLLGVASAQAFALLPRHADAGRAGRQGRRARHLVRRLVARGCTGRSADEAERALVKVLAQPTLKQRFADLGAIPEPLDTACVPQAARQRDQGADGADQGTKDHRRSDSPAMSEQPILIERQGRVGVLTLNRPKQLNALNDALMDALGAALLALDADDSHRRHRHHRQRQSIRRRRRHRRDGGLELHGCVPQRIHHAQLGDHPPREKACDRRRGRLCDGWRLRTGAGLRHHHRGREREVRAAGNQARDAARRRWHTAPATRHRQGQGDGHVFVGAHAERRTKPTATAWSRAWCPTLG